MRLPIWMDNSVNQLYLFSIEVLLCSKIGHLWIRCSESSSSSPQNLHLLLSTTPSSFQCLLKVKWPVKKPTMDLTSVLLWFFKYLNQSGPISFKYVLACLSPFWSIQRCFQMSRPQRVISSKDLSARLFSFLWWPKPGFPMPSQVILRSDAVLRLALAARIRALMSKGMMSKMTQSASVGVVLKKVPQDINNGLATLLRLMFLSGLAHTIDP